MEENESSLSVNRNPIGPLGKEDGLVFLCNTISLVFFPARRVHLIKRSLD